jgi:hypothetical protein
VATNSLFLPQGIRRGHLELPRHFATTIAAARARFEKFPVKFPVLREFAISQPHALAHAGAFIRAHL